MITNGSLFLGMDSILGPVFVYLRNPARRIYLFVGSAPR